MGTDEDLAATLLRADSAPTPAPSTLPTETPQRIGRFIVLEVRGVGGMGVVYLAYDPALDRRVAIKVLRASVGGSQNSGGTTRLVREAQAMAQLSSPHVVPIYDVGAVGQSVFIAMEFIAGQTLQQWLAEEPRTWREALDVLVDAGRGLEAVHRAGLVHRDFKPANVLIGPDGRATCRAFVTRNNVSHSPTLLPVSRRTTVARCLGLTSRAAPTSRNETGLWARPCSQATARRDNTEPCGRGVPTSRESCTRRPSTCASDAQEVQSAKPWRKARGFGRRGRP